MHEDRNIDDNINSIDGIKIKTIIEELELHNPMDKLGILDKDTKKVHPIKEIKFNSDLESYILVPDMQNTMIALSVIAKERNENGK